MCLWSLCSSRSSLLSLERLRSCSDDTDVVPKSVKPGANRLGIGTIVRIDKEIRRLTDVVSIFSDRAVSTRLVGSLQQRASPRSGAVSAVS
jgi:hypothetical protein